ncbi:hypothetical protein C0339_00725 [Salmonella enterica]|nr:hypothetical protein [Salmonella enterica]
MKNVVVKFYDNKNIGNDGKIEFGSASIHQKMGMKQIVALTDKFDKAKDNAHMFKAVIAKLRNSSKVEMTEKQIEKLFVGPKKFFKSRDLVITHIEVVDVKGKKFVAVVASRVRRDSLDQIVAHVERRVFWFGCRFQIDSLTRDVKITCSTGAGVNPYVSVLSETINQHKNGTTFRGGVFKRMETGEVLDSYDAKRANTEKRKAQLKAAKETFKAKKAAAKAKKEFMAEVAQSVSVSADDLENFADQIVVEEVKEVVELPKLTIGDVYAVNLPKVVIDDLVSKAESFNKKEEKAETMTEEKQFTEIMINSEVVKFEVKKEEEEEYRPSSNFAALSSAFLSKNKTDWSSYEVANDDEDYTPEEMSDEDREQMERDADELHMGMFGTGYGCGIRRFK